MSEKDLRDMIAFASTGSERLFNKTGVVSPTWHGVTATSEYFELEPPHPNKDMAVAMVRAYFELRDVVRYIFVFESWTLARLISDDEIAFIEQHGVAAHPDRVEVVSILGEDLDAGMLAAHRRIIRPRHRRPYLAPLEMLTDLPHVPRGGTFQSHGRMVGFLPARGTRH